MKTAVKVIRENSEEIMRRWEKQVQKEVEAAHNTSKLALRNQLPKVLENVVDIMCRYDDLEGIKKHESFNEITSNSLDHGRHRATSTNYTLQQILHEYIIIHRVLTDILIEKDAFTQEVGILIKYTMETAMVYSAGSFSESLQEMRETLIGTLAHDIRNPISTAHFAIDSMNYDMGPEYAQKSRKMALKALKRANLLIEGLLDAITVKAGEGITLNFENMNILEDIKWVVEEAQNIYSSQITLKSDEVKVEGIFDGTALRRILENLVTNAVKYGDPNKIVTVSVQADETLALIKVHNWGNPIPKESQQNIFHFLNHKEAEKSRGLKSWGMGLTLVKTVAQAHGGKIELESNEDNGTTFTLMLDRFYNTPGKKRSKLNYAQS